MTRTPALVLFLAVPAALLAGCGNGSSSRGAMNAPTAPAAPAALEVPEFPGAGAFVAGIDNPWLAFTPGRTFHYSGETDEGTETIVVEVLDETRTILGVATTVVRDRVYLDGELVEDTFDWYAQDGDGNVWYFGEDSKEIEDGQVVSTEGSWEAGRNSAMPGIVMLARPRVGLRYRQELAEDVAEDMAQVVSLTASAEVPYGTFEGCLETREWSPLEPAARENKFYAPGVGLVLERARRGGGQRVELVSIEN